MAAIKIERDWFFPKSMDGNLSLSTQEERINQALKRIQGSDDWLEVDGIKCCSRNEILTALGTPFIQGPMSNPNPQAIPIVCPNCGANTTNRKNCEYCGSMLVRFVDQNIAIDRTVFGEVEYKRIVLALKKNLELQKNLSSTEIIMTQTLPADKVPDVFRGPFLPPVPFIIGGNITDAIELHPVRFSTKQTDKEAKRHFIKYADAGIPSYSEPRLIILFSVANSVNNAWDYETTKLQEASYLSLFTKVEVPVYIREKNGDAVICQDSPFTVYYIDMGQDCENAARILVDFYQRCYNAPENQIVISTEQLSEEQQKLFPDVKRIINGYGNNSDSGSGCSVALLPILSIGAGIAAGVVKLISHLLV